MDLWSIGGGTSALSVCAFCYVLNIFDVVESIHLWLIGGHTSALSICAFCSMWNLFGVVVLHRSMVNWRRGLGNVHSAIFESSVVKWYSLHLWSIGGGTSALSICAFYSIWNLFSVVVFHRSMVNWRRGLGICAFCYMWNLFGVAVFHTYLVSWRGYICPKYMCILLYVKLIWCSGIPKIYGQLEEGGLGICALYYMWKLIWHSSIPYIYGQLEGVYMP